MQISFPRSVEYQMKGLNQYCSEPVCFDINQKGEFGYGGWKLITYIKDPFSELILLKNLKKGI